VHLKKFLGGVGILLVATFVVKGLGFLYKIPLGNFLGKENLGSYQLVFPIFALCLNLTSSAFPCAIASMGNEEGFLYTSDKVLHFLGILGSAILFLSSGLLGYLANNQDLTYLLMIISPAVYFCARISYYRGKSQLNLNFKTTALTEICEQGIKIIFGTIFLLLFKWQKRALYLSVFAVVLAQAVALIVAKRGDLKAKKGDLRSFSLIKRVAPITFSHSFPAFVLSVEGILSARVIGTATYGLYSGVALVIFSIPALLSSSVSTVIVPKISNGKGGFCLKAVIFCILTSIPFCAVYLFMPKSVISTLFFNLSLESVENVAQILRAGFIIPFLQCLSILSSAILYGKKQGGKVFLSSLISGIVKIVALTFGLILYKNVLVVVYSSLLQYSLAVAINLIYIIKESKVNFNVNTFGKLFLYGTLIFLSVYLASSLTSAQFGLVIAFISCLLALVYFAHNLNIINIFNVKKERK